MMYCFYDEFYLNFSIYVRYTTCIAQLVVHNSVFEKTLSIYVDTVYIQFSECSISGNDLNTVVQTTVISC